MRNILLVEPAYRSKFPPLGLMKLSQYHKSKGDSVTFIRGLSEEARDQMLWNRIYVSSLFTYNWNITMRTLKFYRYSTKPPASRNLVIGGVMATLMADEINKAVNCRVVKGLLDKKGVIGYGTDDRIDEMLPDYSILDQVDYRYPMANAYIAYTTRGCIRKCSFCAVPRIEPEYKPFHSVVEQVEAIAARYGAKKDLLLMDNNVLASPRLADIVKEIIAAGFGRGAQFKCTGADGRVKSTNRWVDFNQGIDARLLKDESMELLSRTAIRPLRIAFDRIELKDIYSSKVRLAKKYGITHLSNYILYNYEDTPEDFYERLKVNISLNEELGLQIYSFPMRYVSIESKNRLVTTPGNIGRHWNRKYLRAIQAVLIPTRGVVGPKRSYFERAFGKDVGEFRRILLMPEDYIVNRDKRENDGSCLTWWEQLSKLEPSDLSVLLRIVEANVLKSNIISVGLPQAVRRVLDHYLWKGSTERLEQLSLL